MYLEYLQIRLAIIFFPRFAAWSKESVHLTVWLNSYVYVYTCCSCKLLPAHIVHTQYILNQSILISLLFYYLQNETTYPYHTKMLKSSENVIITCMLSCSVILNITHYSLYCWVPLSMRFSEARILGGLLCLPPRGSSWPRDEPSLCLSALAGRVLTH